MNSESVRASNEPMCRVPAVIVYLGLIEANLRNVIGNEFRFSHYSV
jgi:hypothetical protein